MSEDSSIIVPSNGNGEQKPEDPKEIVLCQVTFKDGQLRTFFGSGVKVDLISHALTLLRLEWDANLAMMKMKKDQQGIQVANSLLNKMRGGFRR